MFVLAFISVSLVHGSAGTKNTRMYGEITNVGYADPDDLTYTKPKKPPVRKIARFAKAVETAVKTVKKKPLMTARTVEGERVDGTKAKTRTRTPERARVVQGGAQIMEEKVHSDSFEQEQERLRREHQSLTREQQREQERLKREERIAIERQIELDHAHALKLQEEQRTLARERRQRAAELIASKELKLRSMKEWYGKLRELAPISDEVKDSFKTLNKEAAEAKVISVHDIKTAILQRFPNSHMVRGFHDNTKSTVQFDRRGIHVLRGGFPISKKAITEIYEKRMLPRALKWQQSKNQGEHFFCCRDFASVFTAVCKEEQIIATNCPEQFAIGEVMLKGYFPHVNKPVDMFGHNECHMINIICDRDADNKVVVHLLEPQSGNFIEPGSFENYDNGIMFVVF